MTGALFQCTVPDAAEGCLPADPPCTPGRRPRPVGVFDPGRDDSRVARCDDALGGQPVQAGADRPLRQPGVADQRGTDRNTPVPSGPAWLAKPTSTSLQAL